MIRTCLTDVADIANRRFKNLRLIIYGGSPMAEATLREAMNVFQCDFAQRYGSTETLCLTWLKPEDHRLALQGKPELLRSAGQPLPGVEIRVVDGNRQELSCRQYGEFIAAGPQLMKRYWKLDDDGGFELDGNRFLRTGDCGFINADNYLYLRDRADDVIISGGENIYPREIEDVLVLHPDIDQAAVIGVLDAKWGEAIKAVVVRRAGGNVSADQLIGYCRQQVAGFKTPRSIDFVADLPRNAAGKILRYQLREFYRRKTNSPTELTE
jgi:acyl-CoA synthetase (AMP-forming)/AMP-acid ligase II